MIPLDIIRQRIIIFQKGAGRERVEKDLLRALL